MLEWSVKFVKDVLSEVTELVLLVALLAETVILAIGTLKEVANYWLLSAVLTS